jgi:glycosyltransferase involved in cell wall biosynthesis
MTEFYLQKCLTANGPFKDLPPDRLENIYLHRYAWPGPLIAALPREDTRIIVVIPSYNESGILDALNSLEKCQIPNCQVEVIIVLNHAIQEHSLVKKTNFDSASDIDSWISPERNYQYHLIRAFDLPQKKAGVGLARKIGMDEAVRRFEILQKKNGIIVCFDADCICAPNYLTEIERTYLENAKTNAALIYFEHDFESLFDKPKNMDAIINYELHLRYYVQALKYANFPYGYHTVGSCITVSSSAYQKQGGMNLRKAGEDFYFLQRIFPLGNVRNITSTKIIPSARPSDRVPFGTGKAIGDLLKGKSKYYHTYNPQSFLDFKIFNEAVSDIWELEMLQGFFDGLPTSVGAYLESIDFATQVSKIKKNCKNPQVFRQAFYNWFNGFKALKYVHFARSHFYPNVEVLDAANWMLTRQAGHAANNKTEALQMLRTLDRSDQ